MHPRYIRYIAIAAAITIAVYGLSITGSPSYGRKAAEDLQTLHMLDDLNNRLTHFYQRNNALPEALDAKVLNARTLDPANNCGDYYGSTFESADLEKIEYRATGNHYTVCANFNTQWQELKQNERIYPNQYPWAQDFKPGRNCFDHTLSTCNRK